MEQLHPRRRRKVHQRVARVVVSSSSSMPHSGLCLKCNAMHCSLIALHCTTVHWNTLKFTEMHKYALICTLRSHGGQIDWCIITALDHLSSKCSCSTSLFKVCSQHWCIKSYDGWSAFISMFSTNIRVNFPGAWTTPNLQCCNNISFVLIILIIQYKSCLAWHTTKFEVKLTMAGCMHIK